MLMFEIGQKKTKIIIPYFVVVEKEPFVNEKNDQRL